MPEVSLWHAVLHAGGILASAVRCCLGPLPEYAQSQACCRACRRHPDHCCWEQPCLCRLCRWLLALLVHE